MKKIIFGLSFIALTIGCGGDSNNSEESSSFSEVVQGSWLSECQQNSVDTSETQTLIFNDEGLTLETSLYEGLNCKRQLQAIKVELDYIVPESSFVEDEDFNIDYVVNSFSLNPKDDVVVTNLNNDTACGFNDWALNVEKNITGQDCTSILNLVLPAQGSSLYNIINISNDSLRIGETSLAVGTPVEGERPDGEYNTTVFNLTDTSSDLDINGQWIEPCYGNGPGSYIQSSLNAFNSTLEQSFGFYNDSECMNPYYVTSIELTNFNQTGRVPSFQGAKFVNFEYQSIQITPGDASAASEMNSLSFCGFTDWVADTPKQVAGVDCSAQLVEFPAAGTVAYNIITVINDTLNFGRNRTGLSGTPEGEPLPFNFFAEGEIELIKAN